MKLGSTQYAHTDYEYDVYAPDPRHAAPVQRTGATQYDTAYASLARGNMTAVTRWNNSGANVITSGEYDELGNVVQRMDGNEHATLVDFGTSADFAYPAKITDPGNFTKLYTWDRGAGQLTQIDDEIRAQPLTYATTTAIYDPSDDLDRVRSTRRPDGGSTTFAYDDANRIVTATMAVAGDARCAGFNAVTDVVYDGLGRKVREVRHEPDGTTYQDTKYDGMGRVYQVSNPYCASATTFCPNTTPVWTATAYDALGRVTRMTMADGSHTDTVYSGNQANVTDPKTHTQVMVYDGLGRLTSVTDANGARAQYQYDPRDNLVQVKQRESGAFDASGNCPTCQVRTFDYDSLKRLIHAANPENGDVYYTYDANGNLLTRRDARNVTVTMDYEALNRVVMKRYSDGTASVQYTYDDASVANSVGWMTLVTATDGAANVYRTSYGPFDSMGRPVNSAQTIAGSPATYSFSYSYNQAGTLDWMQYPSGRQVTTCYGPGGQPAAVTGQGSRGTTAYGGQHDVQ